MDYSFYYDAARHALDWTAACSQPENLPGSRACRTPSAIGDVGFSHGSPLQPGGLRVHLRERAGGRALPVVDDLPGVTFIGHSHLCKVFALAGSEVVEVVGQKFGSGPATSTSSPWVRWASPATTTTGPAS